MLEKLELYAGEVGVGDDAFSVISNYQKLVSVHFDVIG